MHKKESTLYAKVCILYKQHAVKLWKIQLDKKMEQAYTKDGKTCSDAKGSSWTSFSEIKNRQMLLQARGKGYGKTI